MSKKTSLPLLNSDNSTFPEPVMVDMRGPSDGEELPVQPTTEKQTELAAKHDFAGKFRHPQVLDRLKAYIRAQAAARQTLKAGQPLDRTFFPKRRRSRSTSTSPQRATTRATTASIRKSSTSRSNMIISAFSIPCAS